MAADSALMARARSSGEAVLRVYGWSSPALSFGRNETVRGRFAPETLSARGYDAVRRPTGGRVLLHDGEVTYSVTMPALDTEPVRAAYARINSLLASALARLGVQAEAAPRGRELRPGQGACFAAPAAGELVLDGRKLVASAQWRDAGALLQHGSILLTDRQGVLHDLAGGAVPAPVAAATLCGALGREVSRAEVYAALRGALEAEHGEAPALDLEDVTALAVATEQLVPKFSDPQWTWRR